LTRHLLARFGAGVGRLRKSVAFAIFAVTAIVLTPFLALAAFASQPTINAPPMGASTIAYVLVAGLAVAVGVIVLAMVLSADTRQAKKASFLGRFDFLNIAAYAGFGALSTHRTQKAGWSALRRCIRPLVLLAAVAGIAMYAAMAMGWGGAVTLVLGLVIVAPLATFVMTHGTSWTRATAGTAGISLVSGPASFLAAARDKVDATVVTIAGSASSAASALGFTGSQITQLSAAA
jgi:hypothetical protein